MSQPPFRFSSRVRAGFVLMLAMTAAPAAFADSVQELHSLVDANDPAAWEMAQRMEPENAGDPEFDFWYGLAAKTAGQKHQAEFAFERVVMSQPDNARAKLELADSYYQFGNFGEARKLFEDVLASTPPDNVQQRIRTYLGAIDASEKRKETSVSGYVTLSGGHDSNINSATSVANHEIVGFAFPVSLAASAVETDADFADLRAGVDLVHPFNNRKLGFLGASLQSRDNEDILSGGNFDYTQATVTGGVLLQRGIARWRIPVNLQALTIESDESRYLASVGAEYSRPLSAQSSLSWFGQIGEIHFPSQEARNTHQALLGGSWSWSATSKPLRLMLSAHVGTEPATDSDFEFNGRDYVGVRVTASYTLTAQQSLYGALGVQQSDYQAELPLLGLTRQETLSDVSVGWQYQFDRRWSANFDLAYSQNESDGNDLYDFERTVAMLGATWRF